MARKRYSDEDALKILREIDVHLHDGLDVVGACRKAGISDIFLPAIEFLSACFLSSVIQITLHLLSRIVSNSA